MDYYFITQVELYHILYGILGALLLLQLYFVLFVYGRLARYKVNSQRQTEEQPPISIILCARNEHDNLERFLPSILTQDYPDFEVIVVNDCSSDDSKWLLQELAKEYPQLRVVEIKEHIQLRHSKKFALTLGIKAAKHDRLVLTDADCLPDSFNWLAEISGAYKEDTEIVLGYSPYFKEKGFLNKLIRFETAHTAMSYLAYALKSNAYMGVGRNLSYTKSLFFKGKGFNAHMHIKSGDDDLFVNHNATKNNVTISVHRDAHTYSIAKKTWKSYYRQKARHSGASVLYKSRHKSILATQLLSSLLFYLWLIVCVIVYPEFWYWAVAAYLSRLLCQLLVFKNIYRKLAVGDILFWIPILDVVYYFYICINGLFNRGKKQSVW
ncbi:MAG TPA: glycosyltransferase [Sphingobacterium sp.]|nr:glycosyltransferase [Sphingobacterium sp.]